MDHIWVSTAKYDPTCCLGWGPALLATPTAAVSRHRLSFPCKLPILFEKEWYLFVLMKHQATIKTKGRKRARFILQLGEQQLYKHRGDMIFGSWVKRSSQHPAGKEQHFIDTAGTKRLVRRASDVKQSIPPTPTPHTLTHPVCSLGWEAPTSREFCSANRRPYRNQAAMRPAPEQESNKNK